MIVFAYSLSIPNTKPPGINHESRNEEMILLFKYKVKLLDDTGIQELTDRVLNTFKGSEEDRCPHCGKKDTGKARKYTRWVTDITGGQVTEKLIKTKRYECGCGKTHVVIPALIVLYASHSLRFIIAVLYDYYCTKLTVCMVCDKYGISARTLYRWKKLFERDKELWLRGLRASETKAVPL